MVGAPTPKGTRPSPNGVRSRFQHFLFMIASRSVASITSGSVLCHCLNFSSKSFFPPLNPELSSAHIRRYRSHVRVHGFNPIATGPPVTLSRCENVARGEKLR